MILGLTSFWNLFYSSCYSVFSFTISSLPYNFYSTFLLLNLLLPSPCARLDDLQEICTEYYNRMYLCEGQKWDLEFEVAKREFEVLPPKNKQSCISLNLDTTTTKTTISYIINVYLKYCHPFSTYSSTDTQFGTFPSHPNLFGVGHFWCC